MYSSVPVHGGLVDRFGANVAGTWQNELEGSCWTISLTFSVIFGTENADGIAGSVGRKGNITEGWLHAHAEATAEAHLEKQPVLLYDCWCCFWLPYWCSSEDA